MLAAAVAVVAVVTVAGLAAWWPAPVKSHYHSEFGAQARLENATVLAVTGCPGQDCQRVAVAVDEGSTATRATLGDSNFSGVTLHRGDKIVVARAPGTGSAASYSFADFQRGRPLALLAVVFALTVIVVARWRGFAALLGLALAWLVLVKFVLPALLDGENPPAVALIGTAAIMIVVLYLAHGVSVRTTTALLGTFASLTLTAALAAAFTAATRVSGAASEEASYIHTSIGNIDLHGLVLAGVVISSLGILNDVTVTQASAVWEISAADPSRSMRELYSSGMRVGRDHIASTVYTLVLAYAGASLPLLLLFTLAGQPMSQVVTGDAVAEEILRTLVGGIGLVAAVPITTALAASLASTSSKDTAYRRRGRLRSPRSPAPVGLVSRAGQELA